MMRKIAFYLQKGGVGKTTLCGNVGFELAHYGCGFLSGWGSFVILHLCGAEVSGIRIAYEIMGRGVPVVWTPGGFLPRNPFAYTFAGRSLA